MTIPPEVIAQLREFVEQRSKEQQYSEKWSRLGYCIKDILSEHLPALLDAAERAPRYEAALTPSLSTQAAYIGEFGFSIECTDEDGEAYSRDVLVPWTTVKEIMAAIRNQALSEPQQKEGE